MTWPCLMVILLLTLGPEVLSEPTSKHECVVVSPVIALSSGVKMLTYVESRKGYCNIHGSMHFLMCSALHTLT